MDHEVILKEEPAHKDDFRVVWEGDRIEAINRDNQVFHFIDLSYLKKDIIFHGWNGFRTTRQMKDVLEGHFMDIYRRYHSAKVLVDSTRMSGSFNEANDWLATVYMPGLIQLGLKKVAIILPHNIFAQMAVDDWDRKIDGFVSRNFGSVNEGLTWLMNE
jgi:hypothetical protein